MDVVEEHKDHHSTQNGEEAPMHFATFLMDQNGLPSLVVGASSVWNRSMLLPLLNPHSLSPAN